MLETPMGKELAKVRDLLTKQTAKKRYTKADIKKILVGNPEAFDQL